MNSWLPRTLLLFSATIGLAMTGCGGSDSPAVSIASASQEQAQAPAPVQDWIIGTWNGVVDLDKEAAAKLPDMTPEAIAIIESMQMTVTFDAEGKMKMAASMKLPTGIQESSSLATWEVIESNGDQLTIRSQEEGHDPEEVKIARLDSGRFSMPAPQNVGAMVFTRAQ